MVRRRSSVGGAPFDRQVIAINKGLLTDLPALGRADGSTIDEENVELLRDGSRRRRRGLQNEAGSVSYSLTQFMGVDSSFASYVWENVGGNPNLTFYVVKVGIHLYFYEEDIALSSKKKAGEVDLALYASQAFPETSIDYSYIANEPFTFTSAHGHLFVASAHTYPFYIMWDAANSAFTTERINFAIRDFVGVEDGLPLLEQPSSTNPITDSHYYNLLNRGWTLNNINNYKDGILAVGSASAKNKYPSKAMIPYKAMVRTETNGSRKSDIYSEDWTRKFDADALENQLFGNTSAPQGNLLLNPFDTVVGRATFDTTKSRALYDIDYQGPYSRTAVPGSTGIYRYEFLLRFWFADTGSPDFTNGEVVTFKDTVIKLPIGGGKFFNYSLENFVNTVTTASSGTKDGVTREYLDINFYYVGNFRLDLRTQIDDVVPGFITNNTTYTRPNGYTTFERPRAVAFYANRLFYAGTNYEELADKLFFSQLTLSETDAEKRYGRMYQEQNPTSEFFNQLVPTDGGVIEVANLGTVVAMVPVQNSLVILTKSGIWELNGGEQFFSATSYVVRKLADVEVLSNQGWCLTDQGLMVASASGVYAIRGDTNSNLLTAQNVTYNTIQSLWLDIPIASRDKVLALYNDLDYKVSFFYNRTPSFFWKNVYDTALIYDLRQEAWTKNTFDNYNLITGTNFVGKFIHGVIPLASSSGCTNSNKFKYLLYSPNLVSSINTDTITFGDLRSTSTTFSDVMTNTEKPAYLITNYDLGDAYARYKYAPYLVTHCHKVETGYTLSGGVYVPVNPGGLSAQGLFNFSSGATSNKWTAAQQAYKPRPFVATSPTSNDGFALYASKLKLRGRGRSVALRYSSQTAKDFHIAGFAMEYDIERNI